MHQKIKPFCYTAAIASAIALAFWLGCRAGTNSPTQLPAALAPNDNLARTIPYPEGLELDGAAGHAGNATHADSRYFVTTNDWFAQESGGSLTILSHFATYQQTRENTCGPASILMVLHHYGVEDTDELTIAQAVSTDETTGTSVENLRDYFVKLGWQVNSHVSTQPYFADVSEFRDFVRLQLQAGRPIIVNWQRWDGHWAVIIGLDTMNTPDTADDVLIIAEPYDTTDHSQDGYYVVGMEQFFYEWHEGNCAGKADPYQQPFVVAYP